MASTRDPRRMDSPTAEQWQRRRAQETGETKVRRRVDARSQEQSPLQEAPTSRSNPPRKSISRAPPLDFSPFVNGAPNVESAFDVEKAPKQLVPDHSPALTNSYKKSEEPPISRKSVSRRRKSTISTPDPDIERSQETGWSTPQIPVRRELEQGLHQSSAIPTRGHLKPQEFRSARANALSDAPKHRPERRRQEETKPDRAALPLPKGNFQEDLFLSSTSRQQTDRVRPPEQLGKHSRTQDIDRTTGREREIKGAVSPSITQDGLKTTQPNVPGKKSGRDLRAGTQGANSYKLAALEGARMDERSLLRNPESIVAPHDSWNRSTLSPPREEDRILPPKSRLASYQRTPEPDRSPRTPTAERRPDGRTDRTPPFRNRQRSEYPLSPLNEPESTPPSSGATYYATASEFSSDPSAARRAIAEDQSIRKNTQKQSSNNPMSNRSRRSSFTSARASPEDCTQSEMAPNTRNIAYSNVGHGGSPEQPPSRRLVESSPRLRGIFRSNDSKISTSQLQSNSTSFVARGQLSKPLVAAHRLGDAGDANFRSPSSLDSPHPINRLRNDDSMTYVAVTASGSSPQSELDGYDDLSEASHYTDHEAFGNDDVSSRTHGRTASNNTHASQRRVALLTGLGLSLTNLDGNHSAGDSTRTCGDYEDTRGPGSLGVLSPDAYRSGADAQYVGAVGQRYSPLEDDKFHELQSPGYGYTGSHPDFDHLPPTIQSPATPVTGQTTPGPFLHGGTPRGNTRVSSGQSSRGGGRGPGDQDMDNDNETSSNVTQISEQVSRGDARRNTWVYDEAKVDSLPTRNEGRDTRRAAREGGNDSPVIEWSDNDSLGEPLSEDARRMFDRLQHENLSQDAQRGNLELDGGYQDSRERTSQVGELDLRVPTTKDNEVPSSPVSEEIPQMETNGIRTWRRTISSSAYQSLLKKHGIVEMKRQDVIFELCETEAAFVKSMKLVIRLFVDPLRSRGHWLQGLPTGPMHLFEWLDDIVDLHTRISSALHSSRASQFPLMLHFAETFRPFVYRLEAHQPYLVHLELVTKELESLVQDSGSKYGQFIRSQSLSPECRSMGLTSFLLKPMQRLTKYPLFFKQIWELTPRSHPDHLPMFSLYNSTNLVIKVMQEVKAREEEFKYIEELVTRVTGFPEHFQLARRERRLIAQGLLRKIDLLESDKETLDGFNIPLDSSRNSSPRAEAHSPTPSPMLATPPIPELGKLGPVTSPLFPSYHNRTPMMATPPSPYTPRRSNMSAVSRASTALSEASRISEWTATYSPPSSLIIPSDFDDVTRPDSSTSSVLSHGHVPFVPYGQGVPSAGVTRHGGLGSVRHSTRGKRPKETPIYIFVFTDLVILTSQTEKAGLFQSKQSQTTAEKLRLIEDIGISRVLGVVNRSGKLDYEHLIQVDLLPMSRQDASPAGSSPPTVCSVYLTLPTTGNARLNLKPTDQMKEARDKWISALDRCYGYTLRALTFPFIATETPKGSHDFGTSSVMTLLASGLPLPKSPSHQPGADEEREWDSMPTEEAGTEGPEWWSRKFKDVLREIERIQDTPVMLIGDAALTMGRGLKRVHTADRTRRNGPQQLLLPVTTAMSSPSASSGSSQGRRSILGIKRR